MPNKKSAHIGITPDARVTRTERHLNLLDVPPTDA